MKPLPPDDRTRSAFRVGEWVVEPRWNRLVRGGEARKVEPRVMQLLVELAAEPGCPIGRDRLLDTVWPGLHVNEEALSRAISQLRKALDDDPRRPRYIETVHKGGYSLIAAVEPVAGEQPAKAAWPGKPVRAAAMAIFGLAIAALALWLAIGSRQGQPGSWQVVPLTSGVGREIDPALSPDGSRLVYGVAGSDGVDLFWRPLAGDATARLTRDAAPEGHPSWSPDGSRIAFVKRDGAKSAIYIASLATGLVDRVLALPDWSYGLDWSPDGRTLAFCWRAGSGRSRLALFDVQRRTVSVLTNGRTEDVKPVFSPDGRRLAFLRSAGQDRWRLLAMDLPGKTIALIGGAPMQVRGLDWAPDGTILYSAKSGTRYGLWRLVPGSGQAPQELPLAGGDFFNPSVAANGAIAAEAVEQDRDIWRSRLDGAQRQPLIRSTFDDYRPAYSPDGRRIVFVSERSGTPELWLTAADSREMRQLTTLRSPIVADPVWSRDGRRIAFAAERDGKMQVLVTGIDNPAPAVAGRSGGDQWPIGWSRDGRSLFVLTSDADDRFTIGQMSLSTSRLRRLSPAPLRAAVVSSEDGAVYALSAEGRQIWKFADQARPGPVPLPANLGEVIALRAERSGLYLIVRGARHVTLQRLDPASGKLQRLQRNDDLYEGDVSLRPGGSEILYTVARESGNDVVLIRPGD